MSGMSVGGAKGLELAVKIDTNLQKKAIESAETSMKNLLDAMPKSANPPGVGGSVDVSA
ncbi:MAG: putative motility protein [Fibrobacterota bacterium]